MKTTLVIALAAALCANAQDSAQYLMVDQDGNILPSGYTAGITEIAATEAAAAAASEAAQLLTQTANSASNIVNGIVDILTGATSFTYVTGHTLSFSGAVEVSTNASALIVFCEFGVGSMTTNGTDYTAHYLWHAYSEAMNTTPAITYKQEVNATNAWTVVPLQSTARFDDTTVNGVFYPTVYRSTVYLPSSFDTAFFMAFCEIIGGGQAGGMLDIAEGISIGGKIGPTATFIRDGYAWTYVTGVLVSVTNAPAE